MTSLMKTVTVDRQGFSAIDVMAGDEFSTKRAALR
jgi:hypothetical protein